MKPYDLTAQARIDYFDAYDFIASHSGPAAERWETRILEAFDRIAEFPHSGRIHPEYGPDYLRFWVEGQYLVIYDPDAEPLQIIGILHGAQDLFGLVARRVIDYNLTDEE
jgi:toxin ParE1/3/4